MNQYLLKTVIFGIGLLGFCVNGFSGGIELTPQEIQTIGNRIFENECAGKDECLVQWNDGEDFLSLGIGHFIWYPQGRSGPFDESFPGLIQYLGSSGQDIPDWLNVRPFPKCPWSSREDFIKNRQTPRAVELYQFLIETKSQPAVFLIKRLNEALPLLLNGSATSLHEHIEKQFKRMIASTQGVYVLIDYINFKGLGVSLSERYQGTGWGLLQVLSEMKGSDPDENALEEFAQAADKLLTERVHNAPPQRNEQRWLRGWKKRVRSYSASENMGQ